MEARMSKILIIDDDPDVVEAGTLVLEREGHEVLSAANAADGKASIHQHKPDLLILDVMMDEPDEGIVLAQQLRKEGFDRPILMLTSLGKVTGLQYGRDDSLVPVDAYMEKPVDPNSLIEAVRRLLSGEEG
jgi:DNA-binding response OmpR family regulator